MIFFVDKLTTGRFKFPFKDTHTVFRHFILNGMAYTINKIRKIFWNEVSFEAFYVVKNFLNFISDFSKAWQPFKPGEIVIHEPITLS